MTLACSVCISDSVDGRIIWVISRGCLRVCLKLYREWVLENRVRSCISRLLYCHFMHHYRNINQIYNKTHSSPRWLLSLLHEQVKSNEKKTLSSDEDIVFWWRHCLLIAKCQSSSDPQNSHFQCVQVNVIFKAFGSLVQETFKDTSLVHDMCPFVWGDKRLEINHILKQSAWFVRQDICTSAN